MAAERAEDVADGAADGVAEEVVECSREESMEEVSGEAEMADAERDSGGGEMERGVERSVEVAEGTLDVRNRASARSDWPASAASLATLAGMAAMASVTASSPEDCVTGISAVGRGSMVTSTAGAADTVSWSPMRSIWWAM